MKKVELVIGSVSVVDGCEQDTQRPVEFVAEELGSRRWLKNWDGTRGTDETLYKTDDGRLVVYIEHWSRWAGEENTRMLVEVQAADLDVGGRFEMLGRACGLTRALTLDEALSEA